MNKQKPHQKHFPQNGEQTKTPTKQNHRIEHFGRPAPLLAPRFPPARLQSEPCHVIHTLTGESCIGIDAKSVTLGTGFFSFAQCCGDLVAIFFLFCFSVFFLHVVVFFPQFFAVVGRCFSVFFSENMFDFLFCFVVDFIFVLVFFLIFGALRCLWDPTKFLLCVSFYTPKSNTTFSGRRGFVGSYHFFWNLPRIPWRTGWPSGSAFCCNRL